MNDAEIINLTLKDGTATGIIKYQISGWNGLCYKIPRNKLNEKNDLEYINNSGVYILFGEDEDKNQLAYIGQTDDSKTRSKNHNSYKDYWNDMLIFLAKDKFLNTAHTQYIENKLYDIGINAKRFIIKNKNTPHLPPLEEHDKIIANQFMKKIKLLTSIIGYRVFDELLENNEENDKFYLNVDKNRKAYASFTNEGLVVHQNSYIRKSISSKLSPSLLPMVERERKSSDIVNNKYVNNHLFSSPSRAAVVILGRNSNGWNEWKSCSNNKKLGDIINR